MNRFFLLLLICFWHAGAFAQKTNRGIDSLLTVLKTAKEDTNKVKTLNTLCLYLRNSGDPARTKEYAEQAIMLADQLQFKRGKATAYNTLGLVEMERSNNPEALKNFNLSLKLNEEIGNKQGAATNISNIGNVYWSQANYPEALKYYNKSLKICDETNNKNGQLSIYNNIGSIYGAQGNYPEALKNFLATLKLAKETGNKYAVAISYKNIGTIYGYEKNRSEALKNYTAGLKVMEELENKQGIASAYGAIGEVSEGMGNYKEALDNFLKALKMDLESGSKWHAALMYNHIGQVYIAQADFAEALENLRASLTIREEIGNKEGIAESNVYIGQVFSKQAASLKPKEARSKYNEAIQSINKGIVLAKLVGYKETEKAGYGILSGTYKAMNDLENAMKYNKLYFDLKDSMMNNETTRKLEQLRLQFEVEKAVEQEKVKQEKAMAEQKFLNEKALAEKNAKHELELAEERVQKEKAIEIEKLKYAFALAEEKALEEKRITEQNFESERKLAGENARHQQALVEQKALQEKKEAAEKVKQEKKEAALIAEQEKQKADQKRKTELLILGASMLIVILVLGSLYQRQKMLKQKAMERVETVHKMAELELQSLRAQLNPHFMFNSLNAIQDLILKEDNRSSHRYLSRFSKLLRMLLDNANQPFIPLRKELDFLELYLSLENLRIPDLHYSIKTEPGIDAETTLIPNMMMQPYIENAIWHGLSHKTNDKKLDVNIHRVNGSIQCDIEDNGVGREKAEELKSLYRKEHRSKGMELLSKRFNLLSKEYGTDIQTRVTDLMNNGNAAGTLVEISVPLTFPKKSKEILYDTNHNN